MKHRCKRGYAVATGSLAVQPFDVLHEYALGLHVSECPSRAPGTEVTERLGTEVTGTAWGKEEWPLPWKAPCPLDARMQFVAEYLNDQGPVAPLCRQDEISRNAGDTGIDRYEAGGWPGVREHSRAPHPPPRVTPGGDPRAPGAAASAASARGASQTAPSPGHGGAGNPLASPEYGRRDSDAPRRRRRRPPPSTQPLQTAWLPNDVGATDCTGWVRTHAGTRIAPVTLSDLASR